MAGLNGIVLGFDPGGKGNFGWSVCSYTSGKPGNLELIKTGLADDAWDALSRVKDAMKCNDFPKGYPVLAAGIDAPLFWSREGNREIEFYLRKVLKGNKFPRPPHKTVLHVNSLMGACSVQGPLLAKYVHEEEDWEGEPIVTESHPTALLYLVNHIRQRKTVEMVDRLTREFNEVKRLRRLKWRGEKKDVKEGPEGHRLDATLAAVSGWAAWEAHQSSRPAGWKDLYDKEPKPVKQPFGTPVSYWMPIP